MAESVKYDCGCCGWTYSTENHRDGVIKTVRHYNYEHSMQGWLYQKLKGLCK